MLRLYRPQQHGDLPAVGMMLGLLDEEERVRAARMEDTSARAAFVAGRYLLRCFVAELLGVDPRTLDTAYSCPSCAGRGFDHPDHGRPGYTLGGRQIPFRLSLSRAQGTILFGAIPSGTALWVGVDLESVRAVGFDGFDAVALTAREQEFVSSLSDSDRRIFRARLWARKEALVKVLGIGFSHQSPGDLDVLEDPRIDDANLPALAGSGSTRVGVQDGDCVGGLVAAVALAPVNS